MRTLPKRMPERIENAYMRNVTLWQGDPMASLATARSLFGQLFADRSSAVSCRLLLGIPEAYDICTISAGEPVGYRSPTLLCENEPVPSGRRVLCLPNHRSKKQTIAYHETNAKSGFRSEELQCLHLD
jgi:hypothetical protein